MIIFVAAHDKNFGIGYKGGLPWPAMKKDKDRLHKIASGKTIVMGERTYHDYKDYKKTYKTKNVYVISLEVRKLKDATILNTIGQVLDLAKDKEVWVLGGGNIFKQLLAYADMMYLTEIEGEFESDTFFPKYDASKWQVISREQHDADELNPHPYSFVTLKRKHK